MLSPQNSLQKMNIPTADCQTAADETAKWAAVQAAVAALNAGTYVTPNAGSVGAISFNLAAINSHYSYVTLMYASVASGDVAGAHHYDDLANGVGASIGLPIVGCPQPDINILANSTGWMKTVASEVLGGQLPQLSTDPVAAQVLINQCLAATQTPAAPAPATLGIVINLPGPMPGMFVGQTETFPDGSVWIYTAQLFAMPPATVGPTYQFVRIG